MKVENNVEKIRITNTGTTIVTQTWRTQWDLKCIWTVCHKLIWLSSNKSGELGLIHWPKHT